MDMSSDSPAKGIPGAVSNTAPNKLNYRNASISQGKTLELNLQMTLKIMK